jgi:sugar phosphate isomerase/epimerase
MNGEDPAQVLADAADLIGHVHASEPDLLPLGDGRTDHAAMAAALRRYLPAHTVCIEMLAAKGEAPLASIDRAVAAAVLHYGR